MAHLAIATSHLRKEFGRKVAVADLTLNVQRGEVFGFLGPNGAGKTTSVKMLLGLTAPTSGNATLLDAPLGDRKTRARIGYLPEHFRFYPWLTATEFLDLQGRLYGLNSAERRARVPRLLKRVGLHDATHVKLAAFSKGMTQRIGLAQALINDPDLVFLDEPTSGLDPIGRRLVREIIAEMSAAGTAVFLNSHLLSEVEQTCRRVAFIREGRVLETHDLTIWDDDAVTVKLRLGAVSAELLTHLATIGTDVYAADDGIVHLSLSAEDEIPPLVNWLTANGHAVYELNLERLSLEDRFLRIVGETSGDLAPSPS